VDFVLYVEQVWLLAAPHSSSSEAGTVADLQSGVRLSPYLADEERIYHVRLKGFSNRVALFKHFLITHHPADNTVLLKLLQCRVLSCVQSVCLHPNTPSFGRIH
jgi:hypothetical protein